MDELIIDELMVAWLNGWMDGWGSKGWLYK